MRLDYLKARSEIDRDFHFETDDACIAVSKAERVRAIDLVGCLFMVHVPESGDDFGAWHAAGMDLYHLNQDYKKKCGQFCSEVELSGAKDRLKYFRDYAFDNPGITYILGPNAGKEVAEFCHLDFPNNRVIIAKTPAGPVDVTVDLQCGKMYYTKYQCTYEIDEQLDEGAEVEAEVGVMLDLAHRQHARPSAAALAAMHVAAAAERAVVKQAKAVQADAVDTNQIDRPAVMASR